MVSLTVLKNKKGVSLLEMIVYITILSFLVAVIVSLLSGIMTSEKRFVASKNIQISMVTALDRLTREIRQAESVNVSGSTLNTSPGILSLNTTDDSGTAKTILFSLNGGVMHVVENSVDQGPITERTVQITSLIFNHITASSSNAVRIRMTAESGQGQAYKSETFYSTIVLRGSY